MKILTYGAVHSRLLRELGRAKQYVCPCGQPAVDWAYQHSAEQEYIDANGHAYSLDLRDYKAMCRTCHTFLDHLPHVPKRAPIVVLEGEPDPEYWAERNLAGAAKARDTRRQRMETDPEYAEAVRENSQVNGLAAQERHLEKFETDPEYAAKSRAASVANLAVANRTMAAKRATDPEFDTQMRTMHQEYGRMAGLKASRMRRKCNECPMTTNPGLMSRHQKASGHKGWTDAREDGGSDLRS